MSQSHLSQPKGLPIFFATEMWERYGFYVIQGLLILYLIQFFKLSDDQSYAILGSFTALAYCTPIIGGYLADKVLGYRHAVISGGILLCIGYAIIASFSSLVALYLSLGVITIGTGLLKPNVSGLLGTLYSLDDPRRDSGFTLFYVGINVGIILASVLSGYIARYFGWQTSFASASLCLVMGTMIFYFGTKLYKISDNRAHHHQNAKGLILAYCAIFIFIGINAYVIDNAALANYFFITLSILTIIILLYQGFNSKNRQERTSIWAFFILTLISVVFWAIYFQMYFSLNLFILRVVNHHFLGLNVPTPVFLGIEAAGIILFGPLLSWLWRHLKKTHYNPSTPTKFAIGLLCMSVTIAILLLSTFLTPIGQLVSPLWLTVGYLILSIGELSLSAIGLAMVTELIPRKLVGLMMGIWFVSLGIGGKLAGLFADFSAIPTNIHQLTEIETIYRHAFLIYFIISLLTTLIAFALCRYVKKLIHA